MVVSCTASPNIVPACKHLRASAYVVLMPARWLAVAQTNAQLAQEHA